MNKEEQFQSNIVSYQARLRPMLKQSHLYASFRLGCIILALLTAIYADQSNHSLIFLLTGCCFLLFLILVKKHNEIKANIRKEQAKIAVSERLLHRFHNEWQKETGTMPCPKEDSVSVDLDILGESSLYDYLAFCATPFGKKRLVSLLRGEDDSAAAIHMRQTAVQELLNKQEVLLNYESGSVLFSWDARQLHAETLQTLIAYGKKEDHVFAKWFTYSSILCGVLCITALLLAFFHVIPYGYGALVLLFNLLVSIIINNRCHSELSLTKDMARILKDYDLLFQSVEHEHFESELLRHLQEIMQQGRISLTHLKRVLNIIVLRHNILSYLMLAALLQFDVICVLLLERWRSQYGIYIEDWLQAAGDMEALVSISVPAQVKTTWCFPEIVEQGEPYFELINGFHPLLEEEKAVANSLTLHSGTLIITGSNMSGKTTFLRTLGIAAVMARAGAPVCAKSMRMSRMQVYTSMRIKDDVKEGISTFYAELLRIRQMMDAGKQKQPMLVLIDEIFKGTNSADRLLCAKTAITKLHLPWIITVVSTHDFELCDLEHDDEIQAINAHFSEYYINDEIHFDYLLKAGRCTSTNAKELMRLAGIDS